MKKIRKIRILDLWCQSAYINIIVGCVKFNAKICTHCWYIDKSRRLLFILTL